MLELGSDFLGQGEVVDGIRLPTGAVWQPTLLVFGTLRSALSSRDGSSDTVSQWANRLDLFVNLNLTGTERILLGLRPLDDDGLFSGYEFGTSHGQGRDDSGWRRETSARIETLFFEGDLGELFPRLDRRDARALDIGVAVGRQPLFFQEGLLLNDRIDAVGLTRNTLRPEGTSNLRVSGIWGWGDVHRLTEADPEEADLFGLFTALDGPRSSLDLDLVVVRGQTHGDSLHVGFSGVQRRGRLNTALRALTSTPFERHSAIGRGQMLFGEVSWTPHGSHHLTYVNGFAMIGRYTPAASDPLRGGPLARAGLLFASSAVGSYGAALNADADTAGLVFGHQLLLGGGRSQLVSEVALQLGLDRGRDAAGAVGARYQHAFGRRTLVQFDLFAALAEHRRARQGARIELLIKF